MINMLKNLHKEESGQDLIEYALIAALIAVAAVASMTSLAGKINTEFSKVGNQLT
jgi:pilus assembly protein Flp/PilA